MKLAKTLGLVSVMAAVLAVAAPALASPQFLAPESPATWSGEQVEENFFLFDLGETYCESVHFTASTEGAQNELQVTPIYDECESFGLESEVSMNGCTYNLDQPSEVLTGTMDIVCPGENEIEIDAAGLCTVYIGPQANLSGVSYVNSETWPTTVTAELAVEGIAGEWSGFFCAPEAFENGTYSGSVRLIVESGETQVAGAVGEVSIGVPAELKFAMKGEKLDYEIKNKGTVPFEVTALGAGPLGSFEEEGSCSKKPTVIKANSSCTDKIKCLKLDSGTATVTYTYGSVKSTLKCG